MSDAVDTPDTPQAENGTSEYRVLARKYRPQTFEDLVGQETLVRTLRNAFAQNRIHHAFVLTGVRGVGKTTTARIVAKGLNCTGPDGTGGPTMTPCGVCENCRAIAEDRHVDVMEMDAASRTGVDDVREIIESVRYRPVSARYKVYIVDEVHMLTRNAFNALLKTLEEPPEHVKFIFATTEIRKVPITVLSRCQRFDLRRIDVPVLTGLFESVCAKEGVEAEAEALRMIARAADGSARDGLSILDQAMALATGPVTAAQVRDMLGLVDRERVYDLFEAVMAGRIPDALDVLRMLYDGGADPVVVIQDLMELTHAVTRMKAAPKAAGANDLGEAERDRGRKLAETLPVPALTRSWQMLSKGLGEVWRRLRSPWIRPPRPPPHRVRRWRRRSRRRPDCRRPAPTSRRPMSPRDRRRRTRTTGCRPCRRASGRWSSCSTPTASRCCRPSSPALSIACPMRPAGSTSARSPGRIRG